VLTGDVGAGAAVMGVPARVAVAHR
jgi:acetyltransferase-like isoleucine patch superfamily enzyme